MRFVSPGLACHPSPQPSHALVPIFSHYFLVLFCCAEAPRAAARSAGGDVVKITL